MDLPQSLPEAWTWISSLTPESWANFRLGLVTVLGLLIVIGLGVWLWRKA